MRTLAASKLATICQVQEKDGARWRTVGWAFAELEPLGTRDAWIAQTAQAETTHRGSVRSHVVLRPRHRLVAGCSEVFEVLAIRQGRLPHERGLTAFDAVERPALLPPQSAPMSAFDGSQDVTLSGSKVVSWGSIYNATPYWSAPSGQEPSFSEMGLRQSPAILFGNGQRVQREDTLPHGRLSIGLMVKADVPATETSVVWVSKHGDETSRRLELSLTSASRWTLTVNPADGGTAVTATSATVNAKTWHQVFLTVDADEISLRVGGQTVTAAIAYEMASTTADLVRVGAVTSGSEPQSVVHLAWLGFWSQPLSSEVLADLGSEFTDRFGVS